MRLFFDFLPKINASCLNVKGDFYFYCLELVVLIILPSSPLYFIFLFFNRIFQKYFLIKELFEKVNNNYAKGAK